MKNIKNILIGILLICTIIFGYKTFFSDNSQYKENLKQLEAANKKLQEERVAIDLKIDSLNTEYKMVKDHEAKLAKEISDRDSEIAKDKAAAAKSRAELDKFKNNLTETQCKIAEMKSHPANRTGNDLLNSLKLKTQK